MTNQFHEFFECNFWRVFAICPECASSPSPPPAAAGLPEVRTAAGTACRAENLVKWKCSPLSLSIYVPAMNMGLVSHPIQQFSEPLAPLSQQQQPPSHAQCARTDLNKRFLPKQMTTTG